MGGLAAMGGAAAALRLKQRRPQTACEAVGLLYATQTGNTETVAGYVAKAAGLEAADIGDYAAEDLTEFDGLIVGCPTWNTDADEYRSGTAWDDIIDDIKGADLSGKTVAVFGCGDQEGYGDNFTDGIEELHETFKAAGAKMIGYVDASEYNHQASKSERDGKFLGCPFDEDNQGDLSEGRAEQWVAKLKSEGMPLILFVTCKLICGRATSGQGHRGLASWPRAPCVEVFGKSAFRHAALALCRGPSAC